MKERQAKISLFTISAIERAGYSLAISGILWLLALWAME